MRGRGWLGPFGDDAARAREEGEGWWVGGWRLEAGGWRLIPTHHGRERAAWIESGCVGDSDGR